MGDPQKPPPQDAPLPRVPLTADSTFQNRALLLGIQIVQALNRCAAAIETEKGFEHRVHCPVCRSRSWESRSDDGTELHCSACETKKAATDDPAT